MHSLVCNKFSPSTTGHQVFLTADPFFSQYLKYSLFLSVVRSLYTVILMANIVSVCRLPEAKYCTDLDGRFTSHNKAHLLGRQSESCE